MKLKNLYTTNEYVNKNPSMHEEDATWKITKIKPLIDVCLTGFKKKTLNLLDVGGGTGKILKNVSSYIDLNYRLKVNKYALDLTPKILELQKKNNPDLIKALNEDIKKTSLMAKEIDITLMIDVLEHVPNPKKALKELRRISDYVIFKVPLEKNLSMLITNFITLGGVRRKIVQRLGHVNVYSLKSLEQQLEKNGFHIINSFCTNSFEYWVDSNRHRGNPSGLLFRTYYRIGYLISKLFPSFAPLIMNDFAMILAGSNNKK